MHDGNQRYKIHIRLHGRHRGKGPAMPRLKAPCGHREIQSRHKVQRREMRQAPPPREMARSRQTEAHRMHPVHVSLTRMRHGDSLPSKLAVSPMGQNLLQYSRTPFSELFFQANGAVKATANAAARAYPSGTPHTDKRRGIPTAAARENHLQSQAFSHPAPDAPSCGKKRRPGSPTPRSSTNGCTRNSRP